MHGMDRASECSVVIHPASQIDATEDLAKNDCLFTMKVHRTDLKANAGDYQPKVHL